MKFVPDYRVLLFAALWLLTACTPAKPDVAPATATVAPTAVPAATIAATVAPTPVPAATTVAPTAVPAASTIVTPTLPPVHTPADLPATALAFVPATYRDEAAGFELDYPADWTLDPSSQVGVRGGQALLLSPGTTPETLASGGTRVAIVTYLWDPKNDIAAYVAQRKLAWDASGFAIVKEEQWQLADGRTAYNFAVKTPDVAAFFLLTTVGEDYLQIAGEGDLALIETIARTLRPLTTP